VPVDIGEPRDVAFDDCLEGLLLMKSAWTYMGFSHQRVPSLSKVTMRSVASTNESPGAVTDRTKPKIAFFAGPSFQLGKVADSSIAHAPPAAMQAHLQVRNDAPCDHAKDDVISHLANIYPQR